MAELSIYGYPDYQTNYKPHDGRSKRIELNQYGLSKRNRVKSISPFGRIDYSISTLPGHSGSPIVTHGNIIGLHLAGALDGKYFNIGNLITVKLMENLIAWAKELNGTPFIINQ
jgi:V8-like Glu-specific endopeptidase